MRLRPRSLGTKEMHTMTQRGLAGLWNDWPYKM